MKRLVIGYGNPLRQDDGFGWRVAERLQAAPCHQDVVVLCCHQLTPELAEPISRCEQVIFVDTRVGKPQGMLEWQQVSCPMDEAVGMTHFTTPQALLALAEHLYGSAPKKAHLLTVRSTHLQHGEDLSPEVAQAVEEAVVQIQRMLTETPQDDRA
jgi:hydrogenase maturation protease